MNLPQNYGNLEVTLTVTGANETNQIFVGSMPSGFGEVFDFGSGATTITKTFGYMNEISTLLDIRIYSKAGEGQQFQPFTFNMCVSCPTTYPCTGTTQDCIPCYDYTFVSLSAQTVSWMSCSGDVQTQVVASGETISIPCAAECSFVGFGQLFSGESCNQYFGTCETPTPTPTVTQTPTITPTVTPTTIVNCVSGATLNITQAGWIKYTDCYGDVQYINVGSTGSYTISGCLYCNSILQGFPYSSVATWSSKTCGPICGSLPPKPETPTPTPTITTTITPTKSSPVYYYVDVYVNGSSPKPNEACGNYPIESKFNVFYARPVQVPQNWNNIQMGGNISTPSNTIYVGRISNIPAGTSIFMGMKGWSSGREIQFKIDNYSGGNIGYGAGVVSGCGGFDLQVNQNRSILISPQVYIDFHGVGGYKYGYCNYSCYGDTSL